MTSRYDSYITKIGGQAKFDELSRKKTVSEGFDSSAKGTKLTEADTDRFYVAMNKFLLTYIESIMAISGAIYTLSMTLQKNMPTSIYDKNKHELFKSPQFQNNVFALETITLADDTAKVSINYYSQMLSYMNKSISDVGGDNKYTEWRKKYRSVEGFSSSDGIGIGILCGVVGLIIIYKIVKRYYIKKDGYF